MSQQVIPVPLGCCDPCIPSGTSSPPGPQGPAGADGTNGAAGDNAWTTHADGSGTMPTGEGSGNTEVLNTTSSTAFIVVGGLLYVETWGWMRVVSLTSSSVTVSNPADTATGAYSENAASGTTLAPGLTFSMSGPQGPAGVVDGSLYLLKASNLSDVANAATSRANLGLGTISTFNYGTANGEVPNIHDASGLTGGESIWFTGVGLESKDATAARTSLGLGTAAVEDVGTADGEIPQVDNVAGLTNGDIVVATATGIETLSASDIRDLLGISAGGYGLLGSKDNVDLDDATDNTIAITGATRYRIDKMTFESPSAAVTTATAGMFTAASGGGTTLASIQALSGGLTGTTKFMDLTPQAVVGTTVRTEATLYLNISTPEGSTRSANFRLYGWIFAA